MASLKKERLTPILGVLYILPSAVILLEDASCGNKFFYCIPIPLSASTWEMCKVLPSRWAQLERAERNVVWALTSESKRNSKNKR